MVFLIKKNITTFSKITRRTARETWCGQFPLEKLFSKQHMARENSGDNNLLFVIFKGWGWSWFFCRRKIGAPLWNICFLKDIPQIFVWTFRNEIIIGGKRVNMIFLIEKKYYNFHENFKEVPLKRLDANIFH